MEQPELGTRVSTLRQEKGFTQEQLAEYCEVSTRTIQRIENGEVEPRPFTRNSLSNVLEFDFNADQTKSENLWLAVLHLSSIFVILIIPLLVWSWKKNQSTKIDEQGRAVLNFQITVTLMLIGATLLLVVVGPASIILMEQMGSGLSAAAWIPMAISVLFLISIGIFTTYEGVANTIRVMTGKQYHYPLSIPFLKV
jgi:uncharacterized Tic20 family protein